MLQNNLHSVPKKLVLLQGMDLGKGEIKVFGSRMQLLPAELFAEMVKASGNDPELARLQYESCRIVTEEHYARMRTERGMKQGDLLKWAHELTGLIGWGNVKFLEAQALKGDFMAELDNSAVAVEYLRRYGKASKPVCHMLAGGIAGAANAITGRDDMEAVEVECLAAGGRKCSFACKPKKKGT